MELGEKLKQARLDAGLSQRQLCGDTITRNMLSQIENGTANPSVATLQVLANRLGKPITYFREEELRLFRQIAARYQIEVERLCTDSLYLLVRGDHPLAERECVSCTELKDLDIARLPCSSTSGFSPRPKVMQSICTPPASSTNSFTPNMAQALPFS